MLTNADEEAIAAAVTLAETTTAGEIVCVIAEQAGDYRVAPLIWSALLALCAPWLALWVTDWSAIRLLSLQLLIFGALGAGLGLLGYAPALTPGPVKRREAFRAAREQFVIRRVHATRARAGVLIYVAMAERRAEIMPDIGAGEGREAAFSAIAHDLNAAIATGLAREGVIAAVKRCGAILAEAAPPDGGPKQLPDVVARA